MLCHENIALNPLEMICMAFKSTGCFVKYEFFKSSAAKFMAYLHCRSNLQSYLLPSCDKGI